MPFKNKVYRQFTYIYIYIYTVRYYCFIAKFFLVKYFCFIVNIFPQFVTFVFILMVVGHRKWIKWPICISIIFGILLDIIIAKFSCNCYITKSTLLPCVVFQRDMDLAIHFDVFLFIVTVSCISGCFIEWIMHWYTCTCIFKIHESQNNLKMTIIWMCRKIGLDFPCLLYLLLNTQTKFTLLIYPSMTYLNDSLVA